MPTFEMPIAPTLDDANKQMQSAIDAVKKNITDTKTAFDALNNEIIKDALAFARALAAAKTDEDRAKLAKQHSDTDASKREKLAALERQRGAFEADQKYLEAQRQALLGQVNDTDV